jgi:hypothetical protein
MVPIILIIRSVLFLVWLITRVLCAICGIGISVGFVSIYPFRWLCTEFGIPCDNINTDISLGMLTYPACQSCECSSTATPGPPDDSENPNGGFIIGYQNTPPNTQTSSIDKADILFGIRALKADTGTNGGFYNVIINGVETPTTTPCRIIGQKSDGNDYVSIDTYGGKIYGNIYRTTGVITLFSYDYDHLKNLYPVIVFAGQNTVQSPCRLLLIRFTPDPYFNVSNTYVLEDSLGAGIPSGGGTPSGSKKAIKFNDADLATFFGFRNTVLEQQTIDPNNRMNHTFTSDREFTPADFSDSFVFVLDNINIEAYDGLNNGHLNILHTIVQADIVRQRLVYTAPYPLFLNVKNPYKISLRRIRGRLLREDLSEVALTGIAQITLLIDTQTN